MDLRAYARGKEQYDAGAKETDLAKKPSGPLIDQVSTIVFELARERMAQLEKEAKEQDQK